MGKNVTDKTDKKKQGWLKKANADAFALYRRRKYKEALKCYHETLKLDVKDKWAWRGKGDALKKLNRYEEALVCYDEALKLDAKDKWAWNNKGMSLKNLHRHEEALDCYDEALKLDAKYAAAWKNKGDTLLRLKRLDEALKCIDEAININPNYCLARINRAYILLMQGKLFKVSEIFRKFLSNKNLEKYKNSQAFVLQGLALIAEHQQDIAKAKELNEKIAKLLPSLNSTEETDLDVYKTLTQEYLKEQMNKKVLESSNSVSKKPSNTSTSTTSKQPNTDLLLMTNKHYIIDSSHVKIGQYIGSGKFGEVFRGDYQGEVVAVKRLKFDSFPERVKIDFENEATMMANLHCPRIIRLYGFFHLKGYHMVMEYMENGSLYHVLSNPDKFPLPWEPQRYQIALDIAMGLEFLHDKNIIHRDLKSLNVLLDTHCRAKLADFGLAQIKTETKTLSSRREQAAKTSSSKIQVIAQASVGTLRWMAPELINLKPSYGVPSDMFAFAIVLWELATRAIPFPGAEELVIKGSIKDGKYTEALVNELNEQTDDICPKPMIDLMQQCWKQSPKERYKASEAVAYLTQHHGVFAAKVDVPSISSDQEGIDKNEPSTQSLEIAGLMETADDRVHSSTMG